MLFVKDNGTRYKKNVSLYGPKLYKMDNVNHYKYMILFIGKYYSLWTMLLNMLWENGIIYGPIIILHVLIMDQCYSLWSNISKMLLFMDMLSIMDHCCSLCTIITH